MKILRGLGDEGIQRLQTSGLSDNDKRNADKLWDFLQSQMSHDINFRVHRLTLMNLRQKEAETLDQFVSRARSIGHKCLFDQKELDERILELIIASTPIEEYQRVLLSKNDKYKLKDAIAEGRRFEAIIAGKKEIEQMKKEQKSKRDINSKSCDEENIDAQQFKLNRGQGHQQCGSCRLNLAPKRCPAFGQTCSACGKLNH